MLVRAIYVSDATGDAGSNLQSLAEILGVSDVNNRRDHLTGVLMHHDGQFLQSIEGSRGDVDRLVRRLRRDRRHSNLRFLMDGPVEARVHGEIPMLRVALNDNARVILDGAALSDLDAAGAAMLLQTAMKTAAAA